MVKVYDEGFFDDMIIFYMGLDCDNNLCGNIILEKLVLLKFVFDWENGIMMVVNLMLLIDGVFFVLLVMEEWVKECDLLILVYIIYCEIVVVDFVGKKEGLLIVLVYVVLCMLDCVGIIL